MAEVTKTATALTREEAIASAHGHLLTGLREIAKADGKSYAECYSGFPARLRSPNANVRMLANKTLNNLQRLLVHSQCLSELAPLNVH